LRVLRLEVSLYNVYISNQFQPLFFKGGRGGGGYNLLVEVTVNSKEENSKGFCPNYILEFGLWNTVHYPVINDRPLIHSASFQTVPANLIVHITPHPLSFRNPEAEFFIF
jgi:hypothetical protein